MWGSFQEKLDFLTVQVYTQHVKHAKARGSGGMLPRKILKNRDQKTEFGDISATKAPLHVGQEYVYTLYTL